MAPQRVPVVFVIGQPEHGQRLDSGDIPGNSRRLESRIPWNKVNSSPSAIVGVSNLGLAIPGHPNFMRWDIRPWAFVRIAGRDGVTSNKLFEKIGAQFLSVLNLIDQCEPYSLQGSQFVIVSGAFSRSNKNGIGKVGGQNCLITATCSERLSSTSLNVPGFDFMRGLIWGVGSALMRSFCWICVWLSAGRSLRGRR